MQPNFKCLLPQLALLLLLQFVDCQNGTTDYCRTGLCGFLHKHIACRNKGELSKVCPSDAKLVNITEHQAAILIQHNTQRHLLATGKVENLPLPDKLASMHWNEELEQLAELNVKKCAMTYDLCHNTLQFRNSGQNIALLNVTEADIKDENLIKTSIDGWWNQYKNITSEQVNSFPKNAKVGNLIRNFAVMAKDNNTRVGCAAMRYAKGPAQHFLMTCNYASNYAPQHAIYRVKSLNCQNGYDRNYTALCKVGEYSAVEPLETKRTN